MKILKLLLSLALPLAVGAIAGVATSNHVNTWYPELNKPVFNPPNWLFAPVWTVLYIMMGIGLYLVWKGPATAARNRAVAVFLMQLAFNFLWSFLFFVWRQIGWALIDIAVLWLSLWACIAAFYRVNKTAAWLLFPYWLWVGFATVLNAAIYGLNK